MKAPKTHRLTPMEEKLLEAIQVLTRREERAFDIYSRVVRDRKRILEERKKRMAAHDPSSA